MTTHVSPAAVTAAVPVQLPVTIGATSRPTPASPSPTPVAPGPQDWEQLVTPGHVLGERIKRFGWLSIPVGIVCLVGAVQITRTAFDTLTYGMAAMTPYVIGQFFYVDPDTYTDLGNGVRVPYGYQWLAQFNPRERGLTSEQWVALNEAVVADVAAHGMAGREWTAVAELDVAPQITRPAMVFTERADKLPSGIVSVPEHGQMVQVLAYVEGEWAWSILNPYMGCVTPIGPQIANCEAIDFTIAGDEIMSLKPQPKQPVQDADEAEAEAQE